MRKIIIVLTLVLLSTLVFSNGFDAKMSYKNTPRKYTHNDSLRFLFPDDSGIGLSIENGHHNFKSNDPNFRISLEYDLEIMSWNNAPNATWLEIGPVFSKKTNNGNVIGLETKFEKLSASWFDQSEIKLIPFIKSRRDGMDYMGKLGIILRDNDGNDALDVMFNGKVQKVQKINNFAVGGELFLRNYEKGELEHWIGGYANYKQEIESMNDVFFESENSIKYIGNSIKYIGNDLGWDTSGIIYLEFKPRISYTQKLSDDFTFITSNGLNINFSTGSDIDSGLGIGLYLSAGVRFIY